MPKETKTINDLTQGMATSIKALDFNENYFALIKNFEPFSEPGSLTGVKDSLFLYPFTGNEELIGCTKYIDIESNEYIILIMRTGSSYSIYSWQDGIDRDALKTLKSGIVVTEPILTSEVTFESINGCLYISMGKNCDPYWIGRVDRSLFGEQLTTELFCEKATVKCILAYGNFSKMISVCLNGTVSDVSDGRTFLFEKDSSDFYCLIDTDGELQAGTLLKCSGLIESGIADICGAHEFTYSANDRDMLWVLDSLGTIHLIHVGEYDINYRNTFANSSILESAEYRFFDDYSSKEEYQSSPNGLLWDGTVYADCVNEGSSPVGIIQTANYLQLIFKRTATIVISENMTFTKPVWKWLLSESDLATKVINFSDNSWSNGGLEYVNDITTPKRVGYHKWLLPETIPAIGTYVALTSTSSIFAMYSGYHLVSTGYYESHRNTTGIYLQIKNYGWSVYDYSNNQVLCLSTFSLDVQYEDEKAIINCSGGRLVVVAGNGAGLRIPDSWKASDRHYEINTDSTFSTVTPTGTPANDYSPGVITITPQLTISGYTIALPSGCPGPSHSPGNISRRWFFIDPSVLLSTVQNVTSISNRISDAAILGISNPESIAIFEDTAHYGLSDTYPAAGTYLPGYLFTVQAACVVAENIQNVLTSVLFAMTIATSKLLFAEINMGPQKAYDVTFNSSARIPSTPAPNEFFSGRSILNNDGGTGITLNAGSAVFKIDKKYYYKVSLLYDGYQESELTQSPLIIDTTGESADFLSILMILQLFKSDMDSLGKRITHLCVYGTDDVLTNDVFPLYRLIEQIPLDKGWVYDENGGDPRYIYYFTDIYTRTATYESINEVSQEVVSIKSRYSQIVQASGYMFQANGFVEESQLIGNVMYRSKRNKPSIVDWSNDVIAIPFIITAMAEYRGRLLIFGDNKVSVIDPESGTILETLSGMGCLNQHCLIKTPVGIYTLSQNGLYLYDGNQIDNVGDHCLLPSGYVEVMSYQCLQSIIDSEAPYVGYSSKWKCLLIGETQRMFLLPIGSKALFLIEPMTQCVDLEEDSNFGVFASHYTDVFEPSAYQSFTITGKNITRSSLRVIAQSPFKVSTDHVNWADYLTITMTEDTFSQLIYVRFSPDEFGDAGNYNIFVVADGLDYGGNTKLVDFGNNEQVFINGNGIYSMFGADNYRDVKILSGKQGFVGESRYSWFHKLIKFGRKIKEFESVTFDSLDPGTTYYVRLRAVDISNGESANSNILTIQMDTSITIPVVGSVVMT
jgi:hypothetical protein